MSGAMRCASSSLTVTDPEDQERLEGIAVEEPTIVSRESWDAQRIQSMGYATSVGPNGELRYRFNPRKEVPDDRLFGGVSAELRVDATDTTGTAT